jgi:hypothetical protein
MYLVVVVEANDHDQRDLLFQSLPSVAPQYGVRHDRNARTTHFVSYNLLSR